MGYHVTLPHHFSHLTVPMGCRLWPNYVSILYFFTLQDVTFRSKTRMTACINIAKISTALQIAHTNECILDFYDISVNEPVHEISNNLTF